MYIKSNFSFSPLFKMWLSKNVKLLLCLIEISIGQKNYSRLLTTTNKKCYGKIYLGFQIPMARTFLFLSLFNRTLFKGKIYVFISALSVSSKVSNIWYINKNILGNREIIKWVNKYMNEQPGKRAIFVVTVQRTQSLCLVLQMGTCSPSAPPIPPVSISSQEQMFWLGWSYVPVCFKGFYCIPGFLLSV